MGRPSDFFGAVSDVCDNLSGKYFSKMQGSEQRGRLRDVPKEVVCCCLEEIFSAGYSLARTLESSARYCGC